MFKAIQSGWCPPKTMNEQEYKTIRANPKNYTPQLVGFVGFGCSYAGKWFGGYARGNDNKGNPRNYCNESRKNILNQFNGIQGISFVCQPYDETIIHKNTIIYCDPPYAKATEYKAGSFDHVKFWQWCRLMAIENTVLVSEYTAPDDIECIWQKTIHSSLTKQTGSKQGEEKLFWIKHL